METFVEHFQLFMLLFARIVGLFSSAPIYASAAMKVSTRMILAFFISLVLFPVSAKFLPGVPTHMGDYYLLILSELLVGLFMGFMVSIIFASFQMAGQYFSVPIGFGYTEVLDPVSQSNLPVISTLKNLLGMMLFLVLGAHRVLIESLHYSFEKVQVLQFTAEINQGLFKALQLAIGSMFVVAFQISLPILGILILVSIAEALMGKAAPQLNILQLAFPTKIAIGLSVLIIVSPFVIKQMENAIVIAFDRLNILLREWPAG
ncbi:MAG: flagellar biosynthetic protein FliR [Leptospiraceae bacterium]|nr:flagellar biosynthetic protein FliR [Leptospiraceae bacterium]MCP5499558.1 flagellar biosynthetic protein FliR [Leptospiraceae bacterium]